MATSFYGGEFFGGEFFSVSTGATISVKTGVGGIDPGRKRKTLRLPIKSVLFPVQTEEKKPQTAIDVRIEESRQIQAEVAAQLLREFTEESEVISNLGSVEQMSMAEIDYEIKVLLRKQFRTEDDEVILLMLLAALH